MLYQEDENYRSTLYIRGQQDGFRLIKKEFFETFLQH